MFCVNRHKRRFPILAKAINVFQQDITRASDPIIASSANSPAAEGVANAIDNQSATKYLNFDSKDGAEISGFVVSPTAGASVVTGMTIQSANDAPERDPWSVILEGSNDASIADFNSGEWVEIVYIEMILHTAGGRRIVEVRIAHDLHTRRINGGSQ